MTRACTALLLAGLLVSCAARNQQPVELGLEDVADPAPEQAPRVILEEGAANLDPSARAQALGWLTRLDRDNWAARSLYDPSAWVQRSAVLALVEDLEDPATRALLESYSTSGSADPYVRAEAAIALAEVGSEATASSLSEAWRKEHEPWIIAPLALGAAAHGDTEAVAAVAQAVASGELGLDLDFVRSLGASGHAELLPAMQTGSEAVEEELRLPMAVAQVQLGDPSAEQVLRKALQHADPEIRMQAVELLIELEHPTADALLQRAKGDKAELIQWLSRMALAVRTGEDVDVFTKAWEDPDREVRMHTVRLVARAWAHPVGGSNRKLGRIAAQIVHDGLLDEDPTVRLEGVRAAGVIGLQEETEAVMAQTRYQWAQLRIEAAGSALALGWQPPTP